MGKRGLGLYCLASLSHHTYDFYGGIYLFNHIVITKTHHPELKTE